MNWRKYKRKWDLPEYTFLFNFYFYSTLVFYILKNIIKLKMENPTLNEMKIWTEIYLYQISNHNEENKKN